jgi:aspartate ammonia-lyase
MRTGKDFLGEMQWPADAPWGIHTARALENFPWSGNRVNLRLIYALLQVKKACALTNQEVGALSVEKTEKIVSACDALLESALTVPLPALQGGAGTSTNMFINELIAQRAQLHPIEEVNLHQSTNDVFPTAVKVAAIFAFRELAEKIESLQGTFQQLEKRFSPIPVIGRTEWSEAVPLTLGAQFGAFAEAFARDRWRTFKCEERLRVINLGGTAVGTGLTAPRAYIFLVTEKLRELTGLGLARAENLVDATANADVFVEVSAILKAFACNLQKVCGDLRLLHLQKLIDLPAVQVGSSIMPGKVNPVILESVIQAAIKVRANDQIIAECVAHGTLQINEFMPLLADALLESLDLLATAAEMLAKHAGNISANESECARQFNAAIEIITAFLPEIGYDRATELLQTFKDCPDQSDFRAFLEKQLGEALVEKILSPQHLMALGHRNVE